MPVTSPYCSGCNADANSGARWEKKCTYCCKKYCNKCAPNVVCPHCGRTGEDWTREIVPSKW